MEHLILPTIDCPFPSLMNPHVEAVHEHTLAWVQDCRLVQKEAAIQRFSSSRFAWLTARAYPLADETTLALANDWLVWLFMFDDQFDDGLLGRQPDLLWPLFADLLSLLKEDVKPLPVTPIQLALHDLWQRSLQCTTEAWQARLIDHLTSYFETYCWESQNRLEGNVPEVETYIEKRYHTGGLLIAFDLIEITEKRELPSEVVEHPIFQILTRTTNNVVCWSNDLFSLAKERARGDVNNLVLAIQKKEHLSLQAAMARVHALINEEMATFMHAEKELPSFAPEVDRALQRYLLDFRCWMSGNFVWSLETGRYGQVEQTAAGESVSYIEKILH
ncbi:terpene synthase family protein [Tengunoibacter tsumagoiensis]|uniref:Terpene synthase n=1 Tax=Tengunoibacter tsumagoiensis TaxID=2014871 RepID=A0A402AA57_9CHLR|nr:hypothetical protein [Tengunoibacter tsumagoiensis]GCE16057.1 hypothetical protein KTT_59160 [Tengunoibacter tsumagoiensis]